MAPERDTFKTRHFGCEVCSTQRERLQWNYDPAPECCGQPMAADGLRASGRTVQIITDDVPGGFVAENGFKEPQRFDSKSAHRKALAERGLRIADRGEWRT